MEYTGRLRVMAFMSKESCVLIWCSTSVGYLEITGKRTLESLLLLLLSGGVDCSEEMYMGGGRGWQGEVGGERERGDGGGGGHASEWDDALAVDGAVSVIPVAAVVVEVEVAA